MLNFNPNFKSTPDPKQSPNPKSNLTLNFKVVVVILPKRFQIG